MDRTHKQKINKEITNLNTVDRMNLTDIYKELSNPTGEEYTFFSNKHRTLFRIDHISSQKQVLTNLRSKSFQVPFLTIRE